MIQKQKGFTRIERLIGIVLLATIVFAFFYQYRAISQNITRARMMTLTSKLAPLSLTYACSSIQTPKQNIRQCKDLALVSPALASALKQSNYHLIDDVSVNISKPNPLLSCVITHTKTQETMKFKAYKSFVGRIFPLLCPAKRKELVRMRQNNKSKRINITPPIFLSVSIAQEKPGKKDPFFLSKKLLKSIHIEQPAQKVVTPFRATPLAVSEKDKKHVTPTKKSLSTNNSHHASVVLVAPKNQDKPTPQSLLHIFVQQNVNEQRSANKLHLPGKVVKTAKTQASGKIPSLRILKLSENANKSLINHEEAKKAIMLAVGQVHQANTSAIKQFELASQTRIEADKAINIAKPLFSILQAERSAVRESLNMAYYYAQQKNPLMKEQVLQAEKKRKIWERAREKFKRALLAATKAVDVLQTTSTQAFESRQQAAVAARNAQIQAEIAQRYAPNNMTKEEKAAISDALKFVMDKSRATEILYRQVIHQKSLAGDEYDKYINGKVETEVLADQSLERLIGLWGKKLKLNTAKSASKLAKKRK